MKSHFLLAASLILPALSLATPLEPGAALPDVTATDHNDSPFPLAQAAPKGWLLVFFYPKADTPGCTRQACSLRDAFEELTDLGVTVIGASADNPAAQKSFREKHNLPYTLLADPDLALARAFGVPVRGNFTSRQAYLFRDNKLAWRDLNASTDKQAADVLSAIRQP